MWTRKAAFTFTGGVALILIGMMISNNQMMILGLALIAFIVVNSWISGHGDVQNGKNMAKQGIKHTKSSILKPMMRLKF